MPELNALVVFAVSFVVLLLPVRFAAGLVEAKRRSFAWCLVALVAASFLYYLGLLIAPMYGSVVAFVLSGVGFMLILRVGFFTGLGVSLLYFIFSLVIAWGLTELGYGKFAQRTFGEILKLLDMLK